MKSCWQWPACCCRCDVVVVVAAVVAVGTDVDLEQEVGSRPGAADDDEQRVLLASMTSLVMKLCRKILVFSKRAIF